VNASSDDRRPPWGLLAAAPPKPLPWPRTTESVAAELRALAAAGELELPLPGHGDTLGRWQALAELGRRDLVLGRLAEGHIDALAILAEAGREPAPGALYGVWAARSGGTGAHLTAAGELTGTVRFCSGADFLDRALVAALDPAGNSVLVEVDLRHPALRRHGDSWPSLGMDASDSLDVVFDRLPADDRVGPPGFYLHRRGFPLGGAGVAAVWLGGCAGVLDTVLAALEPGEPDAHQRAELGALHAAVAAADATLTRAAAAADRTPEVDAVLLAATGRAVVERTGVEVLERAPKATGATPLSRDRRFGQQLADLQVYLRQHHATKDLAALGAAVLDRRAGS
jgi:hypothetical protein